MELLQAPTGSLRDQLKQKFVERNAVVGVAGIGYVGLPLAVEKAKAGFTVIGYDRNSVRADQVNEGLNYIRDVNDAEMANMVEAGRLRATTDFSSISTCDVVCICVPTPLTANLDPDISYIKAVGEQIVPQLRPGQLICLESTTYPGTTEEVLLPLFEQTGLKVGEDFFLCFSPERVDPGNERFNTKNTNKVVGGVTPACVDVGACFYEQTITNVMRVSSPKIAEMCKVFENTFRSVNIALVNEMALLCDRIGINIWEVLDAAATKPFGIMRFDPGPGVGGHCIPLDPFYLAWKAREFDFHTRFIELAGEINHGMPYFVREKVLKALNDAGRALKGADVLVLGVAYKKDIDDWRESPALKVMQLLQKDGAAVSYHDPFVSRFMEKGETWHSTPLSNERIAQADCVLILTNHSNVDYDRVVRNAKVVVDTRNATKNVTENRNKIVLL